ncbi:MAG: hypothetical protein IKX21_06600, partial [Deltaproteobacteria bacterium]|nr:hypothetical protein [Deltaproteobacteria bacterium]
MLAALNTNSEVTQILLEAGADISAKHRYGFTALDLAVLNPNPGVAGLLKLAARDNPAMRAVLRGRLSSKEVAALLSKAIPAEDKYNLAAVIKTSKDAKF